MAGRRPESGVYIQLTTELSVLIQQRRTELQTIAEKVSEIESDADEHRYVASYLTLGWLLPRSRMYTKKSQKGPAFGS